MEIMTRKEAKQRGLTQYFTGKPCINGHISPRQTSKGGCLVCKEEWRRHNYQNNDKYRRKVLDTQNAWIDSRRDRHNELKRIQYSKRGHITRKQYNERNREAKRVYWREYYTLHKERLRQYHQYRKHYYLAKCRERQAMKRNATPSWADFDKIKTFYKERETMSLVTGIEHHVDHIVPLNSDIVCGLHVEYNLRVIPARDNMRKKNTYDPEYA